MKRRSYLFARVASGLMLAMVTTMGWATTELCAPFRHGVVNESIVEELLASARDGFLYRIQPASSQVGFCVDSPVGRVEGYFRDFQGGLTFAPTARDGAQELAMIKVDTHSLETATPLIEGMLKGDEFFDVNKYPSMLFVSKRFQWVSKTEAVLIGDLTLHGVTRAIGLHVRLETQTTPASRQGEQSIRVKANTLISRKEFGLNALSPMVSDMVSLCMSVEAVRFRAM